VGSSQPASRVGVAPRAVGACADGARSAACRPARVRVQVAPEVPVFPIREELPPVCCSALRCLLVCCCWARARTARAYSCVACCA
jgi:hypothetical protein